MVIPGCLVGGNALIIGTKSLHLTLIQWALRLARLRVGLKRLTALVHLRGSESSPVSIWGRHRGATHDMRLRFR